MAIKKYLAAFTVLTASCSSANAAVSLFIPDSDPYPITAVNLGVDSQGRTTWRLAQGVNSGSLTTDTGSPTNGVQLADPSFTATLVEGPSDAHVVEALSGTIGTVYDDCSIKDGTAVCTAILSATDTIVTFAVTTETVQPFEVQVAESASAAGSDVLIGRAATALAVSAAFVVGAFVHTLF